MLSDHQPCIGSLRSFLRTRVDIAVPKHLAWPCMLNASVHLCMACRSPHLWKDPDSFRPERFSETNQNEGFGGRWAGYRPSEQRSSLYPNEVSSDFAFLPFGGGARKCVGDQFAFTEATVALTMLLR